MPTLRMLAGGLRQFASPGAIDIAGRPAFEVGAGTTDALRLDWTGRAAGVAVSQSEWVGENCTVASPGLNGSVASVLVTAGAASNARLFNRVTLADGRILTAEIVLVPATDGFPSSPAEPPIVTPPEEPPVTPPDPTETLDPNDPLEATAVGTVGTGYYAGYKIAKIWSFGYAMDDMWAHPAKPWLPMYSNYGQKDTRHTVAAAAMIFVDQWYTGRQDANDGVALSSLADIVTAAGSVLTIKSRLSTAPERAILGSRDNSVRMTGAPYLPFVTAHPNMLGAWAYRGECIVEVRWRVRQPSGWPTFTINQNPNTVSTGENPGMAIWALDTKGGSEAVGNGTTGGETDFVEWFSNLGRSTTRGSGIAGETGQSAPPVNGTWNIQRAHFRPNAALNRSYWKVLDDTGGDKAGTTALTLNYDATGATTQSGNLDKLWHLLFGLQNFARGNFLADADESKWTGKELFLDISAIRVWIPVANEVTRPLTTTPYQIDTVEWGQLGSQTVTFPTEATLWGEDVAETISWQHVIDTNGPGGRASEYVGFTDAAFGVSSSVPAGVGQSLVGRTFTLSLSSFADKPGVITAHIYGRKPTTGVGEPYKALIVVKPKMQVPLPTLPTVSTSWTWTLSRDDGSGNRYWDNGNLPNLTAANGGLSVAYMPAWLSFNAATLEFSGTAPATLSYDTDRIVLRCTNALGHVTDQIVRLVWAPERIAEAQRIFVADPRETVTMVGNNGDAVAAFRDMYRPSRYFGGLTGSSPTVKANGGVAGNKRVLAFSDQMLKATVGNASQGIIDAPKSTAWNSNGTFYIAFAAKTARAGVERFINWYNLAGDRLFQYRHSSTSRGANFTVSSTNRSVEEAVQDTNFHVVEIIKGSGSLTVSIDGASSGAGYMTGVLSDTQAFTPIECRIGAIVGDVPDFQGEWGGLLMLSTLPDGTTRSNIRGWLRDSVGL